ncbi:MAG TPA: FecR domain-containing protein [Paludibacter sp.]|nr:FecR domain-containing protein [Paludibacter sp.]
MNEGFITNLICNFFEKDHSPKTQLLFRYWFRLEDNQEEKDETLQELWEKSPSEVTSSTMEDLERLQKRMYEVQPLFRRTHRLLFRQILKYAAVLVFVAMSSVITYYVTRPSSLQFAEFSVPYGECKKMQLSDGSTVWVNAGSTLIYPIKFSADNRTVYLSGEANFSVTKNPKKPFIVQTKHIDVQVLGTKFNVQAYPDMPYTTATLVEGSVKVNETSNTAKSYILKPDEQLTYSNKKHNISIGHVDAVKLTSWNKGYLIFQGASFDEIVATLERKYNVHINYDAEKYSGGSYYGKFNPDESVEQVLSVLCKLAKNTSYQIHGSTVYMRSK